MVGHVDPVIAIDQDKQAGQNKGKSAYEKAGFMVTAQKGNTHFLTSTFQPQSKTKNAKQDERNPQNKNDEKYKTKVAKNIKCPYNAVGWR